MDWSNETESSYIRLLVISIAYDAVGRLREDVAQPRLNKYSRKMSNLFRLSWSHGFECFCHRRVLCRPYVKRL
jgi:hypothetical protein